MRGISHIYKILFLTFILSLALTAPYPGEKSCAAEKIARISAAASSKNEAYTEIGWDALIPSDWNPLQAFEGLDLGSLDDNDPRAELAMQQFRKIWDEAPLNRAWHGKAIKIPGYLVPMDFTGQAELKEFLLVPYFGACIHLPPPPANQIIHVTLDKPGKGFQAMDVVIVSGKLLVEKTETEMGRSGYGLKAATMESWP
jgi:hypothetical protein